jgi:hypothetical protein
MNSNHTQNSTTNNNDNPNYTDFMLSSHLKVPMLSSTSNNVNYQDNNKKSPEPSPIKQIKTSKKSLNNTFKNQFSSNSILQNKMQQLAAVNTNEEYRPITLNSHKKEKQHKNFSNENHLLSGLDNKNFDSLAQQSKQNTNSSQFLNNNLGVMTASFSSYFPPPPPLPPTLLPPGQPSPSKNSSLLAASSIYSAYLAAAAAAAANTNRTPNLNPYLPYLQAIAQNSLTPAQHQQLMQNQSNQNDLFMNAAAAFAAASSFGSSLNNSQNHFQQKQGANFAEIMKLNDQRINEKKARSRSRSPILKKKQKLMKNSIESTNVQELKSNRLEFNEKRKRPKPEKIVKKSKTEKKNQNIEEPLDLSFKPSANNVKEDDFESIKYDLDEEYEGDNDDEEDSENQNYSNLFNKAKKLKTEFKTSSSFTVDKILSNNLNFKSNKTETIDSIINDEEDRNHQRESESSQLFSNSNSPSSILFDNILINGRSDVNNDENIHSCNNCDETFKNLKSLNNHSCKNNNEEKLHKCTDCDSSYKKTCKLQSHLIDKNHSAENKSEYCCVKCKRGFLNSTLLEKHNLNEKLNSVCSDSDTNSVSSFDENQNELNNRIKFKENEDVDSNNLNNESSALDLTINNTKSSNERIDLIYSTTLPSPSQSQTSVTNSPNSAISNISSNNSNDSHYNHHNHSNNNIHHNNNGLLQSLKCIQ